MERVDEITPRINQSVDKCGDRLSKERVTDEVLRFIVLLKVALCLGAVLNIKVYRMEKSKRMEKV